MATDGRTIGGYSVLGEIGRGPFGPLLAARGADGREVVLQRCSAEDEALRRRFEREARDAARLEHPNILRVLDVGSDGDLPFVVQERVDGERVDETLKGRHGWSALQKLGLLTQVVAGLAYAHDQGVLHRDLEPRNLILGKDGTVRIADFGIARLASDESQVTQKGVTYAAAAYMPPEQVRGGEVDHRADIFSFGVLAYELLAARRPFRGKTVSALVYQILYKAPAPLSSVWPEAPTVLTGIVARCLEKEPSDRYPDVHALRAELDELVSAIGAGKYPSLAHPGSGALVDLEGTLPGAEDDELSRSLIARTAEEMERRRTGAAALDATIQEGEAPADLGETTRATPPSLPADPPGAAVTQRIPVMGEPPPTSFDGTLGVDSTGELAQEISQLVAQGNLQKALEQLESTMGRGDATGGDEELPTIKLPTGEVPPPLDASSTGTSPSAISPSTISPSTISPSSAPSNDASSSHTASDRTASTGTGLGDSSSSMQLAPTPPPLPLPSLEIAELERPTPPPDAPAPPPPPTSGAETVPAAPAPTPGATPRASSGVGKALLIGGVLAALLVAVALVFVFRGGDDEPAPVAVAPPAPPASVPAVVPASASTLLIDASPWAEVREVTNAEGFVLDLPVNATTPLVLTVDPGTYRVTLSLPAAEEPQSCDEVEVVEDGQGRCVVAFDVGAADDYFKASGWWR
ncbi:MAG: serine/threonine-protein kinase [Acidobacteriota bacterium]